jgi:FAD dependent monooxygenase
MTVEYACAFGISSTVPGLEAGDQVNAFYDGLTIVTIHGKDGRVFWFIIKKLEKTYIYPDSVRFSMEDATQLCQELVGVRVVDNITFGHVWAKKESVSMTALEENIFRTWHYDRLVCLGDSIHKVRSVR